MTSKLMRAVFNGDLDAVKSLCQEKDSFLARKTGWKTPSGLNAKHFLLNNEGYKTGRWDTPLTQAIKQGSLAIVNVLLDTPGIKLSKADKFDGSPLAIAIAQTEISNPNPEALDILKALHKKSPLNDITTGYWYRDSYCSSTNSPLNFAIAKGSNEALAEMFKDPSEPNSFDSLVKAYTSCFNYHQAPNFQPDSHWPEIDNTIRYTWKCSMARTIAERALVFLVRDLKNAVDKMDRTQLLAAIENNNLSAVKTLLNSRLIDVNAVNNRGETPLSIAHQSSTPSAPPLPLETLLPSAPPLPSAPLVPSAPPLPLETLLPSAPPLPLELTLPAILHQQEQDRGERGVASDEAPPAYEAGVASDEAPPAYKTLYPSMKIQINTV